jgi:ring-1,2-phenylacetyl-CoA epoxidase subunit PaaA
MAFTDRITAADLPKMPTEYQDLLRRVLTIQADAEIAGPNVYTERWLLHAPTADAMYRLARIVAEEIDHYRKFAALLAPLGVDPRPLLHRPPAQRYLEAFRYPHPPSWADVAAFCALIDRVGRFQLEEFLNSSYLPFDEVLPPIMQEEVGHVYFGVQQLKELCQSPEGRAAAQAAVTRWLPRGLDMFGRSDSRRDERFIYWGLKHRTNAQAREEYFAEVAGVLTELGLEVPDPLADRHYL